MWCWMNGEFMRAEELKISPFDHGFLYGAGFFETFGHTAAMCCCLMNIWRDYMLHSRSTALRCLMMKREILAAVRRT